ncbi:MAG: ABC transporter permease, partial [Candidatus Bathyarchaeota archaeon]
MISNLLNMVVKEVKELVRDPRILLGMIIVPLVMFPLMGLAVQTSMETAEESMRSFSIAVKDSDGGSVATSITTFLRALNVTVVEIGEMNFAEAIEYVQQSNVTGLIIIPSGFSENVTEGLRARLDTYAVFRSGGIAESAGSSSIRALLNIFEEGLIFQEVSTEFGETTKVVLDPIDTTEMTIIKGKSVDINPEILFGLMISQSTAMPVGIMMLLIFAMQLAATSVASEKEEKTLETLLTLPINRFTILAGKLTGSIVVAIIGAAAYIVGFNYYMTSFTGIIPGQAAVDLAAIGLAPTLISYLLLAASLFVSLLSALALAISISVFADDVRGAQAL